MVVGVSCTDEQKEAEKRAEYSKIVESRSSQDLLNDLYVGSDSDVEAIARILNVTPSTVERIRKGETEPTHQFEDRIHDVSVYYMMNDQSFSKLRAAVDPDYRWFETILYFPVHHPWWFWTINIITVFAFGIIQLIELLVFLVAWIASLVCSPTPIQDNYQVSINPTVEQVR